jgi:DnaJ-class molecular chaperone
VLTGDPYSVLGVGRSAAPDVIKAAYESKINGAAKAGALPLMQQIDAAYEILRDPQRRRHFDATGDTTALPRISGAALAPPPPRLDTR